jgi:predicted nucleic acid-binding protein
VVCNSSTLIALARIGHLDILEKGIIKKVKPLLDDLKEKGFFIKEDLYHRSIQEAGE